MSTPETDRVVTTTVRGSSAHDNATADQNAVAVRHGPLVGATIVAIAAGHGQTRGSRSHIGARIAADVAATNAEATVAALPSPDADALAALGDVLAARIVEQWQAQVRDLIAAQPEAGEDAAADDDRDRPGADALALSAYGTGLLLAIVTPAAALALQLGNGDIALRSGAGETLRPFAVDGAGNATEADSLALADAQSRFRHAAVDRTARDLTLVVLAAGLDRTTTDPDWPATFAADVDRQAEEHDIDSVEAGLPGRLAGTAGAGDDVTVALVFPAAAATVAPAVVTDPGLMATMANPAVAAAAATAAAPAVTTGELPAVTGSATARRRPWMMAAVIGGVALLAIGLVLALSRDTGSTTPATTVTTTPTKGTSTTVRTTTSTSPSPSSVAPSSAPATVPPPTTLPAAVTVPTTAAPPRTTTPPPPTTSAPPPTTVPVTASSTPTT